MVFMPFVLVAYKLAKKRMSVTRQRLKIDSEYTMIASKVEVMMVFSFACPLLVPLCVLSIYSNLFVYNYLGTNLKWEIYPLHSASSIAIPVQLLLLGVLVSELFVTCFAYAALQQQRLLWVALLASFTAIDVYFIATKLIWKERFQAVTIWSSIQRCAIKAHSIYASSQKQPQLRVKEE